MDGVRFNQYFFELMAVLQKLLWVVMCIFFVGTTTMADTIQNHTFVVSILVAIIVFELFKFLRRMCVNGCDLKSN